MTGPASFGRFERLWFRAKFPRLKPLKPPFGQAQLSTNPPKLTLGFQAPRPFQPQPWPQDWLGGSHQNLEDPKLQVLLPNTWPNPDMVISTSSN
jgi:hypothetical protein